ncbi:LysE family transporter [Rhodopila sp.]|uniref:LysE family transporter n=1 Tax=Rhodopila sp. TaxID=2480087 RepID=UPI003D0D30CF
MSIHQYTVVLGALAVLWLAALVAPGPDFLLVIRLSITQGRAAAISAALGIAAGIAAWGVAGFFGIRAMFVASPWLYVAFKVGGGAYLMLLGFRLLVSSWRPTVSRHQATGPGPVGHPFRLGLLTNLANPKAPLFVSSLFAATLPAHSPAMLGVAAVGLMFALTVIWYVLVARVLTIRRVADAFGRARRWIDRAAGLAFIGFGTRLMLDRSA